MTLPRERLGDHVDFSNGKSSPDRCDDAPVPVYGSNGQIGYCKDSNAPKETSVIGRVGSYCGSIHFSKSACWVTDNAIKATAKVSSESRFWFYAMANLDLHELRAGSGQPLINQTSLKAVELPIPDAAFRLEIAGLLGALDDKIELNRRMSATLEEMARALYRSWFVDFDPVHARSLGQPPAHMDPTTAALFPDSFGEDGLPEGWELGTLGDLIEFNPKERLPKGIPAPYLDMKALPTSGMTPDAPYIRDFTSGTKFRERDTLLARITPCLENGKTAVVDDLLGADVGWGSTEFIVMRAKAGVSPALAYCVARDTDFRAEAIRTMTGSSGRQRADAKRIADLETAVASPAVLAAFSGLVSPMFDRIIASGQESRTLADLRDTLLPRLMSGELRIREAEKQVEEVV